MKKEAFLERIRHALGRTPGGSVEGPPRLLAPLPDWDSSELAGLFKHEMELVGGRVHEVASLQEAKACLHLLVETLAASSYLRSTDSKDSLVDKVLDGLTIPEARDPADADVGITGVRYGVAATGTLILTSEAGRKASLLPMNHIALLSTDQLVPTLAEALEAHHLAMPSAWVQATGPSRTADIELTLTTGVHGPGVVHVILIHC